MLLAASGGPVSCNGANIDWIDGSIVFDRDRYAQDRKFGVSIADSGALTRTVVFGVSGDGTGDWTACGTTDVLDGAWHHVAVQRRRSDGRLEVYVDGVLEGAADGPIGACTGAVADVSGAAGGPSDGACAFGGAGTPGPVYVEDSPLARVPALPGPGAVALALVLLAAARSGRRVSRRATAATKLPRARRAHPAAASLPFPS